jgi:ABC-2 type transport system ATP-binding protein
LFITSNSHHAQTSIELQEQTDDIWAVELEQASVRYRMASERITTLKERTVRRMTGRSVKYNEFWALRNVSLKIHKGEAIGLIGNNGAGKSTLLKVIARVQKPSEGHVVVRGTVAPLIELGAGFHPELTGRENIFMNGAMLGYSQQQMLRKFDSIVEFSGLGNFINAPIRTYSSGMIARLGFSIAVDVEPDILIVDEALSVGDEAFQTKCLAKMNSFRENGTTIFFVTHTLDILSNLCTRLVWLEGGRVRYCGDPEKTIEYYRSERDFSEDELATTQERQIVSVPIRKTRNR